MNEPKTQILQQPQKSIDYSNNYEELPEPAPQS